VCTNEGRNRAGPKLARSTTAALGVSEVTWQTESAHNDVNVAGQLAHGDVDVPAASCGEQEAGAEFEARPIPG
jgi:hypothetical protein